MKFVLATCGTRGDVEPFVGVGRELVRRGHDVRMAVAPDMVGFAEVGRACGRRLRTGFAGGAGQRASGRIFSRISTRLDSQGSAQVVARKLGAVYPVLVANRARR